MVKLTFLGLSIPDLFIIAVGLFILWRNRAFLTKERVVASASYVVKVFTFLTLLFSVLVLAEHLLDRRVFDWVWAILYVSGGGHYIFYGTGSFVGIDWLKWIVNFVLMMLSNAVVFFVGFYTLISPERMEEFSTLVSDLLMGVLILLSLKLFVGLVDLILDTLIGFHQKHNVQNLHRNPLKFAIDNRSNMLMIVKLMALFTLCSVSIDMVFPR